MNDRDALQIAPDATPWGDPISSNKITDGIQRYDTMRDGGYWVHPQLYADMPERYRACSASRDNWFDQGGAFCAVPLSFPQHFDQEQLEIATDIYRENFRQLESDAVSTVIVTPETDKTIIADAIAVLTSNDLDSRDLLLAMAEFRPILTDTIRTLAQQEPTTASIGTLREIAAYQFRHTAREFDERRDLWDGLPNKKKDMIYRHSDFAPTVNDSSPNIRTLIEELGKLPPSQNVALALGSIALTEMREGDLHARQTRLMRDLVGERAAADAAFKSSIRRLTAEPRYTAKSYSAENSCAASERDNSGR